MRSRILLVIFSVFLLVACNDPTGVCGDGYNVCFEVNGNTKRFNANWVETSYGYKIADSQIVGLDTQVFEMGVYSLPSVSASQMSENGPFNTETIFSYKENSEDLCVRLGDLYIVNVDENRVAGNFRGLLFHCGSADSIPLTNGHIDSIPHQ